MPQVGLGQRLFARSGLCLDDVLKLKPTMTEEQAERFLEANAFQLKQAMIQAGIQTLCSLLADQKTIPDPRQIQLEFAT